MATILEDFDFATALDGLERIGDFSGHPSGPIPSQYDDNDDLEAPLLHTTTPIPGPISAIGSTNGSFQSTRNRKRAQKRRNTVETQGHIASNHTIFEHVQLADSITTSYDASSMPTATGAFSACRLGGSQAQNSKAYSLAELLSLGFTLVEWNGIDPHPIVDAKGRIFGVLAGRPRDPSYDQAAHALFLRATAAMGQETFTKGETSHRRGRFISLPFGISYGNGQTLPQRLATGTHEDLISSLMEDRDLCRLANYADAAFQLWAPRLYSHYQECLSAVEKSTRTTRNFAGCSFACATLNLGPQVWAYRHRDSLNLPYGLCSIQSLGTFDPKLGGHLVLWDLKLVIEFPPHSTILIPSACLTHSNVPIQQEEYRMSFTQYSAGGLFRWVSNSCMTESALKAHDRVKYDEMMGGKSTRWMEVLKLFSTYEELTSRL